MSAKNLTIGNHKLIPSASHKP